MVPFFSGLCLQLSNIFGDLLDSIIVDVASECHRIAKLGLDRNFEEEEEELRLSAQARVRVADPSLGLFFSLYIYIPSDLQRKQKSWGEERERNKKTEKAKTVAGK